MESKKLFLCAIMLLSSWVFVGFGEEGNVSADLPCMQKLLPCQPYLKSPSPPPTCCIPLKEMVADDTECLCAIFNDPDILKGLNITQDEALQLPKACGANADTGLCKDATPPTPTPPSPTAPANGSSTGNSTSKSSAAGFAVMGVYGFIAIAMPVLILAML